LKYRLYEIDVVISKAVLYGTLAVGWAIRAIAAPTLPWVITYGDRFAGQLTVGSIIWGSARSAQVGYWIDEAVAGRGVTPTALAMAVDHCFGVVGLHRVEASIRPENQASRRVVEKLGFREEGLRRRYLHIDGSWRDHLCYALTVEDVRGGLLARWRGTLSAQRSRTAS
jgi:ribosomal-protein-alanine N-acetyltransferase